MLVGECKGEKVQNAKKILQKSMVDEVGTSAFKSCVLVLPTPFTHGKVVSLATMLPR